MVLDSILGWALELPLWQAIIALAFIITTLMNLVYYLVTDQKEMKRLKDKQKKLRENFKKVQHDQNKAMAANKKLMEASMQYSKKSFKPMLYTLIPIFLIFGWMAANFAFAPLEPMQEVRFSIEMNEPARLTISDDVMITGERTKDTIEQQASWLISSQQSTNFTVRNRDGQSITRELLIDSSSAPVDASHENPFERSSIEYPKATPFGDFSMFGYQPGWLFTYIIFSVVFSIAQRKLFNIA